MYLPFKRLRTLTKAPLVRMTGQSHISPWLLSSCGKLTQKGGKINLYEKSFWIRRPIYLYL